MTRSALIVAVVVFLGLGAAQAKGKAQPGPEYEKLQLFVGDWTIAGETFKSILGPASKFTGTFTARSILSGFAIQYQGEFVLSKSKTIRFTEIDSYNPATKEYTWNSFNSAGGLAEVTYTFKANTARWKGTFVNEGKQYFTRGTLTFSADGSTFVQAGELSADGKKWMPDETVTFTKVKK